MVRTAAILAGLLLLHAHGARAQSPVYVAVTTAADAGDRGNIPGGAVPSLGGMIGLRVSEAWSIELEVERGFRTTDAGSGEAVVVAFPPSRTPTWEEVQLYGIRAQSDRTQKAGAGWAAHAMWRSRQAGRISIGLLAGLSSRVYTSGLVRTTTFVSPLIDLPANYRLPDTTSTRRLVATGLSGGMVIFVRLTSRLTVAPEFRMTTGFITDDPYRVFRSGMRATWSF